jgi:hypothetical protein
VPFSEDVARGFSRGLLRIDLSSGFVLDSDAAKRVAEDLREYAADLSLHFPNLAKALRQEAERHVSEALVIDSMEDWREV